MMSVPEDDVPEIWELFPNKAPPARFPYLRREFTFMLYSHKAILEDQLEVESFYWTVDKDIDD